MDCVFVYIVVEWGYSVIVDFLVDKCKVLILVCIKDGSIFMYIVF